MLRWNESYCQIIVFALLHVCYFLFPYLLIKEILAQQNIDYLAVYFVLCFLDKRVLIGLELSLDLPETNFR